MTSEAQRILDDWRDAAVPRALVCTCLGAVMLPILPLSLPLLTYGLAAGLVALLAHALSVWLRGE